MRNHTEIRFSDITGNGKFSGKPDLPFEIFFLAHRSPPHLICGSRRRWSGSGNVIAVPSLQLLTIPPSDQVQKAKQRWCVFQNTMSTYVQRIICA